MSENDSPQTKKQALLHVGSVTRDQLEALAQAQGKRWQDLARTVLKDYVAGQASEQ